LVVNLCVVIIAVEGLGAHAFGQNGYRQTGVAIGGERDSRLITDDMRDDDAERLVSTVEYILFLLVLAGGGAIDAFFIGGTELLHFVVGQYQLVALFSLGLQAEERLYVLEHFLKGSLIFLVLRHIVAVILGKGDFLALQQVQIGVVV